MRKARHLIGWCRFFSGGVIFGPRTCNGTSIEETHLWGYKTACGEVFWPGWEGTTNRDDVTCKKCLNNSKPHLNGRVSTQPSGISQLDTIIGNIHDNPELLK